MPTLDIFGPGVTDASADRARRAIDQLLAAQGVRMWHAGLAASSIERWSEIWFGHPDVPELPEAMVKAREVWRLVEHVLEELCGKKAMAEIVGELEDADRQLPWPPLTYPDDEEQTAEEFEVERQTLLTEAGPRPT